MKGEASSKFIQDALSPGSLHKNACTVRTEKFAACLYEPRDVGKSAGYGFHHGGKLFGGQILTVALDHLGIREVEFAYDVSQEVCAFAARFDQVNRLSRQYELNGDSRETGPAAYVHECIHATQEGHD